MMEHSSVTLKVDGAGIPPATGREGRDKQGGKRGGEDGRKERHHEEEKKVNRAGEI